MRTILVLAIVLVASVALAADVDLEKAVDAINARGAGPVTQPATVAAIARAVSLSPDALRAVQAQEQLPWGDVFVAHRIATLGGHPLDKVFAARKSGTSWKLIVEEAKVDEAAITRDLIAAFPTLAPPAAATTEPERKPRGFFDRFKSDSKDATDTPASNEAASDAEQRRKEQERQDFMRGGPRRY